MKPCKYFLALLLLLSVLPRVSAAEQGSITVHTGSGGSVTLFQIKDPEFSGCDLSPTPEAARALADHAKTLPGKTQTPNAEGAVCFPNLEPGLYLLVQRRAGEGQQPFSPFLVSIPTVIGDTTVYDVVARPKSAPPELPQTGQLRWPIPVLTLGGVSLILLGVKGRKKDEA